MFESLSSEPLSEGSAIRCPVSNRVGVVLQAPLKGSSLPHLVRFSDGMGTETALVNLDATVTAEGAGASLRTLSLGQLGVGSKVLADASGRPGVIAQAPLKINMPYLVRFSDSKMPATALLTSDDMKCMEMVGPEAPKAKVFDLTVGVEAGVGGFRIGAYDHLPPPTQCFEGSMILDCHTGRIGVIEVMPRGVKLPFMVRFTDGLDPATGFVWPYHAKMAPAGPMSPNSSTRTGVTTGALEAQSVASWDTNIVTSPWQAARALPATVGVTTQVVPDALQGALAGLQQVGLTQTAGFNACGPPASYVQAMPASGSAPANYLQSVPAPQQQQMSWAPQVQTAQAASVTIGAAGFLPQVMANNGGIPSYAAPAAVVPGGPRELMSSPSFSSFPSTPQQVTRMHSLPALSQMMPSPSFPQQLGSVQMATPGSVQMAPPGSVQMAPPGSVQIGAPGSVQMGTPAAGGGYIGGAYGMQLSPALSNYRDVRPDQSARGYSTPLKYVVE